MAQLDSPKGAAISGLNVLRPLRRRNFALLMAGRSTSEMGRTIRVFARGWLVLELTGSPFLLGLVTSSLMWPMLFMPFFGGVLADRIDRRKLLLLTEFSLTALWLSISVVITLGLIEWWHLMISSLLSGIIQSFGRPAHQAILGNLVDKEELPSAVAINAFTQYWPAAVGLLLATLLIGTIGVGGVFWITAFAQLFTGVTLVLLRWKGEMAEEGRKSVRRNFIEGFTHVRGEPLILGLVLIAAASSLFGGAYSFLLPFFARDILGVGAQGLGVMMLASNIGVSVGAAVVTMASNIPRRGLLLMGAAICYSLLILSFSRSEIFFLSIGLLFGVGLCGTASRTMMTMIMQILAPDHLRGRVMSLQVSIMGLSSIGILVMGAVGQYLGAVNTVFIGGSLYGLVALVIFARMHQLRRFR
ncbi:MAG: MFS transporter [Chloroflexi bacterium]|nr:MFS transporter [Chloroflexota bacterium]